MSNIMDCPYGHRFSKTRYGTICPHCGFDLDTPEKVYVNLIRRCEYSRKAIIFGRIENYVKLSSSERDQIHS